MTAEPFVPLRSSAVTRPARRPSGTGMTTPLLRWARKGGITVAGIGVIAAGAAMLVLPAPAWPSSCSGSPCWPPNMTGLPAC